MTDIFTSYLIEKFRSVIKDWEEGEYRTTDGSRMLTLTGVAKNDDLEQFFVCYVLF